MRSDNEESRHASDQESLDRGYTSDTELYSPPSSTANLNVAAVTAGVAAGDSLASSGEWLYVVGGDSTFEAAPKRTRPRVHDVHAFVMCCETLASIARDPADRVAEHNFALLVR